MNLEKLVEQWGRECIAEDWDDHIPGWYRDMNIAQFARLAMAHAAEEAADQLMKMHAEAKGQHNYFHFAANHLRERFKAK